MSKRSYQNFPQWTFYRPNLGVKTIIHVNQHVIRKNAKTGEREPVLTVKQGKRNRYAHEVEVLGPSRVVYRPDRPLSCGARVWIETESKVVLDPGPPSTPCDTTAEPQK